MVGFTYFFTYVCYKHKNKKNETWNFYCYWKCWTKEYVVVEIIVFVSKEMFPSSSVIRFSSQALNYKKS